MPGTHIIAPADLLHARHAIFREVRAFFEERDFIEVHTPLLVQNPGLEPYLHYFRTRFEPDMGGGQEQSYFLPTSPEYHLKKALARGVPRIFEISRSFRNGELSPQHEPEFHMLEWYRHPGDYREIANDFKALLTRLGERFAPQQPWQKSQDLTVRDAFARYAGLELHDFQGDFCHVMVDKVERQLGHEGPLFLWDYPASEAALARVKSDDPRVCERFEVYWRGVELANAFGELTDPVEQRQRCLADQAARRALYPQEKPPEIDESFLTALGQLSQPAAGIAVGLDRLVQQLLGLSALQQAVPFPHAVNVSTE